MNEPRWSWARYDDIGKVIELMALYDDVLKKDEAFTSYATRLANRISEDLMLGCEATYGKWGSRLEPSKNPTLNRDELEDCAKKIIAHRCWQSLQDSTYVFTYGNYHTSASLQTSEDTAEVE